MIRHFDGTNGDAISAEGKRGVVIGVLWTWRKHRIVPTKKAGLEVLKHWKDWYERQGWNVYAGNRFNDPVYFARKGDTIHAIGLHTYVAATRQRIYPKPAPLNDAYSGIGFEKAKPPPKPRRYGAPRKPIGA